MMASSLEMKKPSIVIRQMIVGVSANTFIILLNRSARHEVMVKIRREGRSNTEGSEDVQTNLHRDRHVHTTHPSTSSFSISVLQGSVDMLGLALRG